MGWTTHISLIVACAKQRFMNGTVAQASKLISVTPIDFYTSILADVTFSIHQMQTETELNTYFLPNPQVPPILMGDVSSSLIVFQTYNSLLFSYNYNSVFGKITLN